MLELALEHARTRTQFGRSVASFQAIRHRLAETYVAIEAAHAALVAAADYPDASGLPACIAKAVAGDAARTTARHAQQTLAGMGFTTEHAFHRYLRRTRVLDQLLGSSTSLTRQIGETVLAERALPALQPL
jgi:alkylation response protein AidB-like acyl-CoA dehydrogenase